MCLQNCVFSPCWTVSSHSVWFSLSHGRPIQTDRPFPTELWVIGIQNHPNNRERAKISGDIPSPLMPLFKTRTEVVLPTPNRQWGCFACSVVGSWSLGGWEWQRRREVGLYAWGEIFFRSVFPPRLGISVGIYDLSPRSWWGGDLSVSISAALCVNLRQGFTQQTALVEILTREERGGIFAASALWVVKVKEQWHC